MCGIYGFVGEPDYTALKNGLDEIQHRGPDSEGAIVLSDKVHLGHRRLSILDLSASGHQPMKAQHTSLHMIFNGEIYNYRDIRSQLSRNWKGNSDTEVILEAFSEWGIDKALKAMSGMFAIALYDQDKRILYLIRDRFGEKPLYYGMADETFLFGSELKSFRTHPKFNPRINRQAVKAFFQYSYVPSPFSIYENIFKLEPGHYLEFHIDSKELLKTRYWSFDKETEVSSDISFSEASSTLEKMLQEVIQNQMISDVPLGAFLSGGVDSSTVVALMQANSSKPVKTFSIGFNEEKYNEAHHAKEVAKHLKTDHYELYVAAKDALQVVPKLNKIFDEPFSDSSQIPTYLVSEMTKRHVTVALSGDGGDEIFGGYNRYFLSSKIVNSLFWAPKTARKFLGNSLTSISPGMWDKISPISGDKIHKLARVLALKDEQELYSRLITHWDGPESPVLGDFNSIHYNLNNTGFNFEENMMICDSLTYLPDDILVKVDRASMSVSLESRVPFLDHHVAEFARSIPMNYKIQNGSGKRILKDILYRHVPQNLIERPKMGFGVPIEHWLRNELRPWAESLLDERKINEQGILDYRKVRKKWDEHQSGSRNWQYHLWDVLMFQDWYENNFVR